MLDNDNIDDTVDSIINQIKSQGHNLRNVEKKYPTLDKEGLEKFVIDNASIVITDSVEMVQALKNEVLAGADGKTVEAVSELVKAVTGAIDALSKLKLSDDKIKGQREIKQMEIEARQHDPSVNPNVLTFSREEVLKRMITMKNTSSDTIVDV